MKTGLFCSALLLLLASAGAQAQLYKWVGADGKVNYTDTPPPPGARSNERKALGGNTAVQADLPFELAQAVQAHPVTLYTMGKCAPCDEGRALLKNRGVPFSEKTVTSNDDIAQLRNAGGGSTLPFLLIGRTQVQGMEPGGWNNALDNAGYPATSKLPKTWRQAAAEPAAPLPPPPAAEPGGAGEANAARTNGQSTTPVNPNAPPGFRF
jgi:glutaredoxin